MATGRLEFRILGPLSVQADGASVAIGGPKQRALLALLLLSANRVVGRDRLIAELFGEQSPVSADHALRNHVSRLRKALGSVPGAEPRLVARAPGYLLRVEPSELDFDRFEQLAAHGREALAAGDPEDAARALRTAEALWHGRPLADLEFEPFARLEVERLEELRLAAVEERIDAELALGRHLRLVAELEAATVEHPLRERFRAQLMLALYRCGRQAESLEVYRKTRRFLNDELGLEPGVGLQELEHAILVQDPVLVVEERPSADSAVPVRTDVVPFKGPVPFEREDADLFCGRERLVDELLALLPSTNLLAIVGASGSGKSSLLRAGLLPALTTRGEITLLRPGTPLPQQRGDARQLIAIDQFEEVFSLDDADRRELVDAIVEAAWDPERRNLVVLALRADHFGRLAAFPELGDLVSANHILLGPLTQSETRRAIEGPAERAGLSVEPALVDVLVDETAGEPGGLPLLSTVLLDVWADRRGQVLTLEGYLRLGGVRGALARHADASVRALGDERRAAVRQILLRLVAGEPWSRRRVPADELGDPQIVDALVEQRLLVATDDGVELAHDALLEDWPTLARWLEDDAASRRERVRLERAAEDWDAGGRSDDALLRGAQLAALSELDPAALGDLERTFLDESRAASTRELDRQRRAIRRLRVLLVGAAALLVALLAAGAVALVERGRARTQATAAIAQRLGAQALVDPLADRSLLLARAALQLDDSPETRSDLLAALLRTPGVIGVVHAGGSRVLDDALSADGRILAVCDGDGNVTFFDTRTMQQTGWVAGSAQLAMAGSYAPLHNLTFSPDGRAFVEGTTNGSNAEIQLVSARTHEATDAYESPNGIAADVAFAPHGRTFVTGEGLPFEAGSVGEQVVLWRLHDSTPLRRSAAIPLGRVVGFAEGGSVVLVTSGERGSLLLDGHTLRPVKTLADGGVGAVAADGGLAGFGHADGSVDLLDLRTGTKRALARSATSAVDTVSFSRDGRLVAAASSDGTIVVWDVASGRALDLFAGGATPVGLQFSPDGSRLYAGSGDGTVVVWDVRAEHGLDRRFRFAPSPALGAAPASATDATWANAVSRDGSLFAVSPGPGRVTVWNARDLSVAAQLHAPVGPVGAVAFSRDGRLLVVAGASGTIAVLDDHARTVVRVLHGDQNPQGVAFTPNGNLLAEAGNHGVQLFDLRTDERVADLPLQGSVAGLALSPDGALLAAGTLANELEVIDVATKKVVSVVSTPSSIFTVAFAPGGRTVATAGASGDVDFWDARTGRALPGTLPGQNGAVTSISFDPRGGRLAATSDDGRMRLWDLATASVIGSPLSGFAGGGWNSFFPDGRHVLAVFDDGTGHIWDVDPHDWAAEACAIAHRSLTRAEWHSYVPQRGYRRICD